MPASPRTQLLDTLHDGYLCSISFAETNTLKIDVISFKPPGLTGPGPIDQTTMANAVYMTQLPGALFKVGDIQLTVAYSTSDYSQILAIGLKNQLITCVWPDGKFLRVWGWIENFEPSELVINGRPTASVLIHVSSVNTTTASAGVEVAPVFAAAS